MTNYTSPADRETIVAKYDLVSYHGNMPIMLTGQ